MSTPTTTPELVPFNSGLRSKVRTIIVRAPEVQDARFMPKPGGIMPEAAIDHAAGLMRSGLRANQIKYLAELHPVAPPIAHPVSYGIYGSLCACGAERGEPCLCAQEPSAPPTIDDILGEAELRLEPARGEAADLPAPVRHFGDDMKIEVRPKPAAFMVVPAEVAGMTGKTPTAPEGFRPEIERGATCTRETFAEERNRVIAPLAAAFTEGGAERVIKVACGSNDTRITHAWVLAMNAVHGPLNTHPTQTEHPEVIAFKERGLRNLLAYLAVYTPN